MTPYWRRASSSPATVGSKTIAGADIDVPRAKIATVIESNGSGKSTLLTRTPGLIPPWTGQIQFDGIDVTGLSAHRLVSHGKCTVPRGRAVFRYLTVKQILTMSARTEKSRSAAATIAKGIMHEPQILPLDEPRMGPAPRVVDVVLEEITQLTASGISAFVIEQNVRKTLRVADHVAVLILGQIRHTGSPQERESSIDLGTLLQGGRVR